MQAAKYHYRGMWLNSVVGSEAKAHYKAIYYALLRYQCPRLAISDMRFRCYLAEDPCKCYYQEAISRLEAADLTR